MKDKPKFITPTRLKSEFFFTPTLLRQLGPPDKLATNPHYSSGPPMNMYLISRVKLFMRRHRAKFEVAKKRRPSRSLSAGAAVKTKTRRLIDEISKTPLVIAKLPRNLESVVSSADAHASDRHGMDAREVGPHGVIAHIRHNYTNYESVLRILKGRVGREDGYDQIMRTVAEQFYKSDSILGKNYSYSFFDFKTMTPGKNQIPAQEDVAAGYAFILYGAYQKFGNEKYLRAARNAMDVLSKQKENRSYEILMAFAPYMAARLNAETGAQYDVQKFMNWTFDGDAKGREGWGVIVDNWGGYDVSGMSGSTVHNGGYGFAMNTFDLAWPLTAMLRYDQRYARAVGKWALNASNTARLFYPYDIPDSLQALPGRKAITGNAIAYEGLIKESIYDKHKGCLLYTSDAADE